MKKGASALLDRMLLDAEERCIPISMLIEITHRCNFDCVHCYQAHQHKATRPELSATSGAACSTKRARWAPSS